MTDKHTLRQRALSARRSLDEAQRARASAAIQHRCLEYIACLGGIDHILLYRALSDEVDTTHLFSQLHQTTYAPVTRGSGHMQWRRVTPDTQWEKGAHGVQEPSDGAFWTPQSGTSLLICPIVGFDRQGNRLGLGLGCFDRWLAEHARYLQRVIGLAFACQEVPHIPCDTHDFPMHAIITEMETIECRTSSTSSS